MTSMNYLTIGIVHGIFVGVILFLHAIIQLIFMACRWINDKPIHKLWFFRYVQNHTTKDEFDLTMFSFFGLGIIAVAIVLVWPLLYPFLFITGSLFAIRTFVRFKKKVNKALLKTNETE